MKRHANFKNAFCGLLLLSAAIASAQPGGGPGGGPGGQGGRGGFGPGGQGGPRMGRGNSSMMLLQMTTVQKELGLSADQIKKINESGPMGRGPGGGGPGGGPGGPGGGPGGFGGPPPGQGPDQRQGGGQGQGRGQRGGQGQGQGQGPGQRPGGPGGLGGPEGRQGPMDNILNESQKARLKQLQLQWDAPMTLLSPEVSEKLDLSDDQHEQINEIVRTAMPRPERGQGGQQPQERPSWSDMISKKASATQKAIAVLNSTQKQTWTTLTGAKFSNWEEPKRRD